MFKTWKDEEEKKETRCARWNIFFCPEFAEYTLAVLRQLQLFGSTWWSIDIDIDTILILNNYNDDRNVWAMTAISCAGRHILRRNARISARASIWRSTAIPLISSSGLRSFHLSRRLAEEEIAVVRNVNVGKLRTEDVPFWKEYKGSCVC